MALKTRLLGRPQPQMYPWFFTYGPQCEQNSIFGYSEGPRVSIQYSDWANLASQLSSHLYQSTYRIRKQPDKDLLSYHENDEVSADAVTASWRLNHSFPPVHLRPLVQSLVINHRKIMSDYKPPRHRPELNPRPSDLWPSDLPPETQWFTTRDPVIYHQRPSDLPPETQWFTTRDHDPVIYHQRPSDLPPETMTQWWVNR